MRLPSLSLLFVFATAGAALGVGGFAFAYARGSSYLGNDPASCANCHVMSGHYEGWQQSSHHGFATCNDCHTPADPVSKYAVKAGNGWHHSMAFTSGKFPDVILARAESRAVIEGQCRHCHAQIVDSMAAGDDLSCIRCHDSVGHLR